jgi:hypothetical protein
VRRLGNWEPAASTRSFAHESDLEFSPEPLTAFVGNPGVPLPGFLLRTFPNGADAGQALSCSRARSSTSDERQQWVEERTRSRGRGAHVMVGAFSTR